MLYLRRIVESRGAEGGYETIYSVVESSDVLSEIIVQAAIVDHKGIIRWSNALLANAPAISVADREHIKVQLNSSDDHLYISTPVVGRASGQWSVQFTRRFMRDDGTMAVTIAPSSGRKTTRVTGCRFASQSQLIAAAPRSRGTSRP